MPSLLEFQQLLFEVIADFSNNATAKTEIDDAQLDGIIQEIVRVSLHCRERMVTKTLLLRGYKVKRYRIRQSLNRVNPSRNSMKRKIEGRIYRIKRPRPKLFVVIMYIHKVHSWKFAWDLLNYRTRRIHTALFSWNYLIIEGIPSINDALDP